MASKIAEAAKAHYDRIKATKPHLDVPEWGIVVYWAPMTLSERDRYFNNIKNSSAAELVFRKALDQNGNRLFTDEIEDLHILNNDCAGDIVNRVAFAIATPVTVEEQIKN